MKTTFLLAAAVVGGVVLAVRALEPREPSPGRTVPTGRTAPLRVVRHGEMAAARAAHQATLLSGGRVLVTGGCGGQGCESALSSAELYDPEARAFRSAPAMGTARASHAAVALRDGRVLVAGGWTGRSATAGLELYEPARNRFVPAGRMSAARMGPAAVVLRDGRVLLAGGEGGDMVPLALAEVYDPATSTVSAVGPMGTPRTAHAAVALADGRVLVVGGHRSRGEVLRSAELFDPATGKFTPTGEMSVPRHKLAAVRLPDGKVLVVGGSDARDHRGRHTGTEIYDPATGKFTPGPEMRWARHKLTDAVAVLPSGAVLVAGGAARPELFDPSARAILPVEGELDGAQMFATATLLRTGGVLVLGGYDERVRSSAGAWLVLPAR